MTAPNQWVLVVEDDDDTRESLAELLVALGFAVTTASDGARAIDEASQRLPSIIILDLDLPILDGWQAARRLRSDPRTHAIPIIALTGLQPRAPYRADDVD